MTIRRFEDLVVWQAADMLRRDVYRLTDDGAVLHDFGLRDQLRGAVGSVTANIAEGFRRYSPRDFAKFLGYAYASAGEAENWLNDGVVRGYWAETDLDVARHQLARVNGGLRSLMKYLRTDKAAANAEHGRRTRDDEPRTRAKRGGTPGRSRRGG